VTQAEPSRTKWIEAPVEGLSFAPLVRAHGRPLRHALTVDLEDWQQSVLDHGLPVSDTFLTGAERLLEVLDRRGTKATFFILGNVAEHSPNIVRRLCECGHEIQTHGYDHTEIGRHTPQQFRADVRRARAIVEDLIGLPVRGYRAPRFSITARTAWALDVLAEEGFRYDSSIVPMRVRGYGIKGWCPAPHRLKTRCGAELLELPIATVRVFGRPLPVGGGGYFRLLPYRLIRRALRMIERQERPAVVYCHPHEFDPGALWDKQLRIPLRQQVHQGYGRRSFARKIDSMLRDCAFGTVRDLLRDISGNGHKPRQARYPSA
jgi:polysaccharide deacetylase family protein (PEP-CTERM system associated)